MKVIEMYKTEKSEYPEIILIYDDNISQYCVERNVCFDTYIRVYNSDDKQQAKEHAEKLFSTFAA